MLQGLFLEAERKWVRTLWQTIPVFQPHIVLCNNTVRRSVQLCVCDGGVGGGGGQLLCVALKNRVHVPGRLRIKKKKIH